LKGVAAEKTKTLLAEGRKVDQQQRADLLGERLHERFGDDDALWALHERLAKRHRRKDAPGSLGYAPGSLCELEMIERCFKGKKAISVHVLSDGWPGTLLDEKGAQRAGADSGQSLEGERFLIEKGDYRSPKHGRDVRSVRGWITFQFLVMRGCRQPWLKKHRSDPKLPVLHPEEFVRRFFFAGMEWDDRLVQNTYFNVHTRKVFFRFIPPVS
jgi:hypothetical protein